MVLKFLRVTLIHLEVLGFHALSFASAQCLTSLKLNLIKALFLVLRIILLMAVSSHHLLKED